MFKNINEIKPFPSASREWKNSMYSYNENTAINAPHNDAMADKIANMVFHLTTHNKINTKSKRMRSLIRRSSTRQLIVSKPNIKQTSDRATVTVHIFDREKTMYIRRLFFLKNKLIRSGINNAYNNISPNNNQSNIQLHDKYISNINSSLIKLKGKLMNKINKNNTYNKQKRLRILLDRKLSYKYKINNRIFTRIIYRSLLDKKNILNNLFMFKFLKWVMSSLNLNVSYTKAGKLLDILDKDEIMRSIKPKNNILMITNKETNNYILSNTSNQVAFYVIPSTNNISQIRLINKILLLTYINIKAEHYENEFLIISKVLYNLFNFYRNKFLVSYSMHYLRKQKLTLSYLIKLYNNNLKHNNLIYGFKFLLGNIYNKDIKLNLINLRYLHLNSDIFTKAITIKLRKKYNSPVKVMDSALRLVKLPRINTHNMSIQTFSKLKLIDWFTNNEMLNKSSGIYTRNVINGILTNMFPYEISYGKHILAHNIIYSIRHKWIRGVRLEAKGRLTRRFTASRSLFKFRYKGTLRNLEYLKRPNFTQKQASITILRNYIRPNVQYTLATGSKRIGVYGLKGWISGY